MKTVRATVSLPSELMVLAKQDAQASAVRFSAYVRLLIERRLGVRPETPRLAERAP